MGIGASRFRSIGRFFTRGADFSFISENRAYYALAQAASCCSITVRTKLLKTLMSWHHLAPGRVDLGIGRAPGGLPRSTKALQQGITEPATLSEKLKELKQFVHNRLDADHPLTGLRVSPIPTQPADIYLLGATAASAELAAELGLPYVFAQFINGDHAVAAAAFEAYHKGFNREHGRQPKAILALSLIVADTEEEAKVLAGEYKNVKIHLENGKTLTVGTLEQAEEYGRQTQAKFTVEEKASGDYERDQRVRPSKAAGHPANVWGR